MKTMNLQILETRSLKKSSLPLVELFLEEDDYRVRLKAHMDRREYTLLTFYDDGEIWANLSSEDANGKLGFCTNNRGQIILRYGVFPCNDRASL